MKKFIIVSVMIIALTGCQQELNEVVDDSYGDRYSNITLYYGDFHAIQDIKNIPIWIGTHIHYQASDTLQTLAGCVSSGHGDCEEKALMYLNIRYIVFHEKGTLCLVNAPDRSIESGGTDINHAVVRYGNNIIEPASGNIVNYDVAYSYSFNHIFK